MKNPILKTIEEDRFIIESEGEDYIFDIKNLNDEDLKNILHNLKNESNIADILYCLLKKEVDIKILAALAGFKVGFAYNLIFAIASTISKKNKLTLI